jgi:small subunit ribosomal protein S20
MPHTKSAWKRLRSSEKRRKRNRTTLKLIKLQNRKLTDAITGKVAGDVTVEAKATVIKLDKAASRGVIHKNKAARMKSKLAKRINKMKAAPAK